MSLIEIKSIVPATNLEIVTSPDNTTSALVVHQGLLKRLNSIGSPYWLNAVDEVSNLPDTNVADGAVVVIRDLGQLWCYDAEEELWSPLIQVSKFLNANTIWYISPTGNSSNSGISAFEPITPQEAYIRANGTNGNSYTLTLEFLPGNYVEAIILPYFLGDLIIQGTLNTTIFTSGIEVSNGGGNIQIRNLSLGVSTYRGINTRIEFQFVKIIGQQNLTDGCYALIKSFQLSDTLAGSVWKGSYGAKIIFDTPSITVTNTPTISGALCYLDTAAIGRVTGFPTYIGGTENSINGKKFYVKFPSLLTNGELLPGTIAGELASELATIASTGSYNDLVDKPTDAYGHLIRFNNILQPPQPSLDFVSTDGSVEVVNNNSLQKTEIRISITGALDTDEDGFVDIDKGGTGLDASTSTGWLRFDAGISQIFDPFLGHAILDNGFPVPNQPTLEFTGSAVSVLDDATNNKTVVSISSIAQSAFTTVALNYTQPASGETVSVSVVNTSWMAVGMWIFIAGGGFYSVENIVSSTLLTLKNKGYSESNTPAGTTILSGAKVSSSGIEGPTGLPGTVTSTSGLTLTNRPSDPLPISGKTTLWATTSGDLKAIFENGTIFDLGPSTINSLRNSTIQFNTTQFVVSNVGGTTTSINLNPTWFTTSNITEGSGLYFTPQRVLDVIDTNNLLGTAASLDVGTGANQILKLDAQGRIPAVDGSLITGLKPRHIIKRGNISLPDRTTLNFVNSTITDDSSNNQLIIDTSNATRLGGQLSSYFLNRANHTGQLPLAAISSGGAQFGQVLAWNGTSYGPITPGGGTNTPSTIGGIYSTKRMVLTGDYFHNKDEETFYALDPGTVSRQFVLDLSSYVGLLVIVSNLNPKVPLLINHNGTIIEELSTMSGITSVQMVWTSVEWSFIGCY